MSGQKVELIYQPKVTLAYRELFDIDITFVRQYGHGVRELDLSNNNIRDLNFLKGFPVLETLVLDNNEVNSHTKIPKVQKLHTLWVNNNKISNLILFIDKLVDSAPNIRFLSMLKNEACPNYFTGKSLQEYTDYRKYVISRLPTLTSLDSSPVTETERAEASRMYASLPLPSKPSQVHEDLRAPPPPKPEPVAPIKKKRKPKNYSADIPEFLNGGSTMGPPPPTEGERKEREEREGESEDDSSEFSSEGGVDSEEWTDEEVEEDKEVVVDTHVWKGPGPEPKKTHKKK